MIIPYESDMSYLEVIGLEQPGGEGEEACGGDPFLCQGFLVGKVDSICVPTIGKGLTTAKLHRRGGLGGRD